MSMIEHNHRTVRCFLRWRHWTNHRSRVPQSLFNDEADLGSSTDPDAGHHGRPRQVDRKPAAAAAGVSLMTDPEAAALIGLPALIGIPFRATIQPCEAADVARSMHE